MHPAFQECIRRLYLLPTRLSMTVIREHTEMQQVARRLSEKQGKPVKLPSYAQVCKLLPRRVSMDSPVPGETWEKRYFLVKFGITWRPIVSIELKSGKAPLPSTK